MTGRRRSATSAHGAGVPRADPDVGQAERVVRVGAFRGERSKDHRNVRPVHPVARDQG